MKIDLIAVLWILATVSIVLSISLGVAVGIVLGYETLNKKNKENG